MKASTLILSTYMMLGATLLLGQIPTTISYQGILTQTDGTPVADDNYNLTFRLYSQPSSGNPIWEETQLLSTQDGLFNAILGTNNPLDLPFDQTYFLGISINGGDELTPRLQLTATPYSLNARTVADGSITQQKLAPGAAVTTINGLTDQVHIQAGDNMDLQLNGQTLTLSVPSIPWNSLTNMPSGFADGTDDGLTSVSWNDVQNRPPGLDDGDDDTQYTAGNGLTLNGTEFQLNTTITDGLYWTLGGNTGSNPANHFLGTADNQPMELRVNSQRALRLEPTENTPNLIGGLNDNSVTAGVVGAVIAGGGAPDDGLALPDNNRVTDDYGTVGGGYGNQAGDDTGTHSDSPSATVGGGSNNIASGSSATISGGNSNIASSAFATVSGGVANNANGYAASVSGGESNNASGNRATVGGGTSNNAEGPNATVSGGQSNNASGSRSTIGGGQQNSASGDYATVGGGYLNQVTADYGTIAGGGPGNTNDPTNTNNRVLDHYGTIGGGSNNVAGSDDDIPSSAPWATIGGGSNNTASGNISTVSGGNSNIANGSVATVGGGDDNVASGAWATVSGGQSNTASDLRATIGGGGFNTASGENPTVGGGYQNTASGFGSTVAGGEDNFAGGYNSTVGGGKDNTADGARATIGGGGFNTVTGTANTVSGGENNTAGSAYSTVSGGVDNIAYGLGATVGGGRDNTATGSDCFVVGRNNTATGNNSFVFGRDNVAAGSFSFAGGRYSTTAGANSFAAGWKAKANHNGTFVWADKNGFDFESTGTNQFLVRASGGVGIGTNTPLTQLHVKKDINSIATLPNHVAIIENTAGFTGNGPDVLALKTSATTPTSATNFITFFDGINDAVGAIEGDGSGGITFKSGGADFAEWLPLKSNERPLQPAEIVAWTPQGLSRNTQSALQLVVVSTRPIITGNAPTQSDSNNWAPVAFVGQVPAQVRGPVQAGDFILPSGKNDGTGIAIPAQQLQAHQIDQVVGQALHDAPNNGIQQVNILVGLPQNEILRALLLQRDARLQALEARLQTLEALLIEKE